MILTWLVLGMKPEELLPKRFDTACDVASPKPITAEYAGNDRWHLRVESVAVPAEILNAVYALLQPYLPGSSNTGRTF